MNTPTCCLVRAVTSSDDGSTDFEVTDPANGRTMLAFTLSAEQLLARLAGRVSPEEIECVWGPVDRLAWVRCCVEVPMRPGTLAERATQTHTGLWPDLVARAIELRERALAALFGGEWRARPQDYGNRHRRIEGGYRMRFFGLLPPGTDADKLQELADQEWT